MTTPANFKSLAEALVSLFGNSISIVRTDRLSGGDINKAYALHLNNGKSIFMKANAKENAAFFTAEAKGLSAIAETKTIATPKILCTGTDEGQEVGYSFLFLDYIEPAIKKSNYWELFAQDLAAMHKADTREFVTGGKFGFIEDNFIGARVQKNSADDSWISFFRDNRLVPQFKSAESYFDETDRAKITKLLDHLEDFLIEPEKASILHGDLWSGNIMCGSDGKAWLIDPACYVGNAEADLAMTELFGGFPKEFYDAYKESNPILPGYNERRDLYNLYHLLNHLNMFGATYLTSVKTIVSEFID
ncbi:fructosamine kinase family protein [uncultured Treponema sp.]|uniref:fructosamine kinase family protein n=1 Tax=uncultured Treponema sp. TaxID=162155 RepID=UPI0025E9B46E|nr:fructosamine kinase family protein [uncultured Treponema sp.]